MTAPMNAAPPGQPYGSWPIPPLMPRKGWRTGMVVAVAALSLIVGSGVGAGIYAAVDTDSLAEAPVTLPLPGHSGTADIGDHAAAQQKTCEVLRSGYPAVSAAIDDRSRFTVNDWNNPEIVGAADRLATQAQSLATSLETSLSTTASDNFHTAIVDYVTGLRALAISERAHAAAKQLNGVAVLYNQVVEPPLQMCGIPN